MTNKTEAVIGKVGNEKVGDGSVTTHPVISNNVPDKSVKDAHSEEDKVMDQDQQEKVGTIY